MPTVLLVEDNFNNVSLIEDVFLFEEIAAELSIVRTGEEAIRRAVEQRPALILMDLRLPGIDGLETTQALKANTFTKDIPVWAITAYARHGDEEQARAAGCCEYLAKPLHGKELASRLRGFLDTLPKKKVERCRKRKS